MLTVSKILHCGSELEGRTRNSFFPNYLYFNMWKFDSAFRSTVLQQWRSCFCPRQCNDYTRSRCSSGNLCTIYICAKTDLCPRQLIKYFISELWQKPDISIKYRFSLMYVNMSFYKFSVSCWKIWKILKENKLTSLQFLVTVANSSRSFYTHIQWVKVIIFQKKIFFKIAILSHISSTSTEVKPELEDVSSSHNLENDLQIQMVEIWIFRQMETKV